MADIKYKHPTPVPYPPTPPIPIPVDYVPIPFVDKQEFEYVKDGIIMNGKTGYPKFNAETGQVFYQE